MTMYSSTDPRRKEEDARRAREDARHAEAAHRAEDYATPIVNRAESAFAAGDEIFFVTFQVASTAGNFDPDGAPPSVTEVDPSRMISGIERLGWVLDKMDHVWAPASSGGFGLGTKHSGIVLGQYLFRRVPRPAGTPDAG